MFSVFAKTNIRILSLSQEFFRNNLELIDGIEEAILEAEDIVEDFGIPVCDYRVYSSNDNLSRKLHRCVSRAKLLKKS